MLISISIFAFSLLFLSAFFALKEREAYTGHTFASTRFLVNHSPRAQAWWNHHFNTIREITHKVFRTIYITIKYLFHVAFAHVRLIVVRVAHKMIERVKGEHLFFKVATPSSYLKHLQEHSKNNIKKEVVVKEK